MQINKTQTETSKRHMGKKFLTVVVTIILVCILNGVAWWNARQTLETVQATADYYYTELTRANYQKELANAEINEWARRTDELKNRLEVANNAVAELTDRNHELRCTNYDLRENSKLRYFESTDELEAFLEESDVDHHIYVTAGQDWRTYDCEDYAKALRGDANSSGFHMNIQAVWRYRRPDTGELMGRYNEGYALNSIIIGNEMYFIEPQTDDYWLAAYLD